MSTLNSLNRNILRLSGLSSGLDTENIITQMMKIDQQKVDKQFRAQTKLEWQVEAYQDVNNMLREFEGKFFSTTNQKENMMSELNYRKYSIAYTNPSDSAYVSMNARPQASEGNITINNIFQLAKSAHAETANTVTNGEGGLDLTWSLFKVNDALKAANKPGFTMTGEEGSEMISFTLDGNEYSISMYNTLDTVINTINANSQNLKIGYTQLTDKFTISSKTMGENSGLSFENSDFLTRLGISNDNIISGQNAKLRINGTDVERSSNNFTIDGIDYTLKQTTVEDGAVNPPDKNISASVTRDIDSTVDLIKNFVDGYNELLEKLQGLLGEKVNRNYYPLTEAEKSDLSEAEVTKWESEAKKGLLRNNSQLSNLISQLRMGFYTKIPGASYMMADIGLGGVATTAEAADKARRGYITLDEDRLRAALKENPSMVFQMFTSESITGSVEEEGMVKRMSSLMSSYRSDNVANTQYYANMNIARAKERYVDMVNAMYTKEEQLWKRFTAMETAMSNLNAQNTWLQQQLSGLGGQ